MLHAEQADELLRLLSALVERALLAVVARAAASAGALHAEHSVLDEAGHRGVARSCPEPQQRSERMLGRARARGTPQLGARDELRCQPPASHLEPPLEVRGVSPGTRPMGMAEGADP